MVNRPITRDQFIALLPTAAKLVRKPMSPEEVEKFTVSYEASKSNYERAQGQGDPDGITKEAGMQMISNAADDAERRQKK